MKQTAEAVPAARMSFHAHLIELRSRLFVFGFVFLVAVVIVYLFREPIIDLLLEPLKGQTLSYLTPGGGFSFIFTVVLWGGLALSMPAAIYLTYGFISPVIPKKSRIQSIWLFVVSCGLLTAGAAFGYFFAIPGAITFLLGFGEEFVTPMLTADSYLHFVLLYTVGLALLFQIPLLMLLIHWVKPLRLKKLIELEKFVVVGAFIIAAILTPTPDAINQAIVAAPIILLYQVGIIAVLVANKTRKGREV